MSVRSACRRAARVFASMATLAMSKLASAGVFLIPLLPFVGGALLLVGGALLAVRLIHPSQAQEAPRLEFSRVAADGATTQHTVVTLGPQGEDDPRLAPFEGLPAPGSSQPAPGVAPTWQAQSSAPVPQRTFGTPYEQALAVATMLRWDDRVDHEEGWPVVNFCRAGLRALECGHNDLWLRNDAPIGLHDVRICVAPAMQGAFRLAGADPDGCLTADIAALGDLHLDVMQVARAATYPSYRRLRLDLSMAKWKQGTPLGWLAVPVILPQTFFTLQSTTPDDTEHAIAVQQRRVNLLAKLVVFTYHGSALSKAVVQTRTLLDPQRGLRIVPASQARAVFERYHLAECVSQGQAVQGQVSKLGSGGSCAVEVTATQPSLLPYDMPGTPEVRGELDLQFLVQNPKTSATTRKKVPIDVQHVVFAGGNFDRLGHFGEYATPAPHLAVLSSAGMTPVPGLMLALQSSVLALGLSPDGTHLWLGGILQPVVQPGAPLPGQVFLASSDGATWRLWNTQVGPDNVVYAIAASASRLYIGGRFTRAGDAHCPGVASWQPPAGDVVVPDAQAWQPLGHGLVEFDAMDQPQVGVARSLLVEPDGRLVVGGTFQVAVQGSPPGAQPDGVAAPNIVAWEPSEGQWQAFGVVHRGLNPGAPRVSVDALAVSGQSLMVGGLFGAVGENDANAAYMNVTHAWARYDPQPQPGAQAWSAIAPELQGQATSFAETPFGLFAGGLFVVAPQGHRALLRLQGGQLSGFDQDLFVQDFNQDTNSPSEIYALASVSSTLCAGGDFTELDNGTPVGNLACRDLLTGDDEYPGQGVDGQVGSLLAAWEMQVGAPS